VILTGKGLYSSTIKEDTEKRGESMADWSAAPRATVSREFSVLSASVLPKIYLEMSRIIGVLVASPTISTEWIWSVLRPKKQVNYVFKGKRDVAWPLHKKAIYLDFLLLSRALSLAVITKRAHMRYLNSLHLQATITVACKHEQVKARKIRARASTLNCNIPKLSVITYLIQQE
jgi:hypothetical protein